MSTRYNDFSVVRISLIDGDTVEDVKLYEVPNDVLPVIKTFLHSGQGPKALCSDLIALAKDNLIFESIHVEADLERLPQHLREHLCAAYIMRVGRCNDNDIQLELKYLMK